MGQAEIPHLSKPARPAAHRTELYLPPQLSLHRQSFGMARAQKSLFDQFLNVRHVRFAVVVDRAKGVLIALHVDYAHRRRCGRVALLRSAPVREHILAHSWRLGLWNVGSAWQLILQAATPAAMVQRQHRISSHTPSQPENSELQIAAVPRGEPALPGINGPESPD